MKSVPPADSLGLLWKDEGAHPLILRYGSRIWSEQLLELPGADQDGFLTCDSTDKLGAPILPAFQCFFGFGGAVLSGSPAFGITSSPEVHLHGSRAHARRDVLHLRQW